MTLLLVVLFPAGLFAHQFYISITTIQHHPGTDKLTVQIKIFVNDLEESIFQERGIRLGLWQNKPIENAQSYVEEYVASNLSILINGTPIPLKFLNQQVKSADVIEDHVIICQLEANKVSEITTIKVHNSLLTEAFDSQTNIVNIHVNDTRKTINLDKRLPEEKITYN